MPEKPKILVVDDEPDITTILRARLEKQNYAVHTACDGLDALGKVREWKPDLILLDIMMPRMDGWEFLQEMKKLDLLSTIPVIILTAKASMREFYLVNGAVGFMVKPFQAKGLLGEIANHLSEKRLNPSSSTSA